MKATTTKNKKKSHLKKKEEKKAKQFITRNKSWIYCGHYTRL